MGHHLGHASHVLSPEKGAVMRCSPKLDLGRSGRRSSPSRHPLGGRVRMRRLFAIIPSSRNWKLALLLGGFVGALAATGFGAYAAASDGNTINACAMKATGQLRLSTNGNCLPSEQAIQWNQTGPPGPPGPAGNTDSTVRHISNFMFDGSSVTTPIL